MSRRLLLSVLASALVAGAGCHHRCCTNGLDREPRPYLPSGPGVIVPPVGPGGTNIPPASVPTTPGGAPFPPPAALPPAALPPGTSGRPGPEVLLPDALPGGPSSRSASPIAAPEGLLGAPVKPQTGEPPVAPRGGTAATGLAGFTKVKDGVAAGGRPALDGFDSLKRAGYRTAVYLHAAGADVAKDRDVAESRGLAFVEIETTPEKLAEALDRFNKTVGDATARPVYVYADDPVRAGAVWYAHFRAVDLMSPEVAKIRARALGLSEEGGEAGAFWVAVQQYLANR